MNSVNQQFGNSLAHNTYANIKTVLSAIFTHAVRAGVVDVNPIRDVSIPKGAPVGRVVYAYTLVDIIHHLRLLKDDPKTKAIIALASFAGLRKGEVRGLMSTDDLGDDIAVHRRQRGEGASQDSFRREPNWPRRWCQ
jgi:hypothetical protein